MQFNTNVNPPEALSRLLTAYQEAVDVNTICSITDPCGTITYVNNHFCEVSRFSRKELLGQDHRIINSGHHPKDFFADMWQTITIGKIWRGEVLSKAKDGTFFWLDSTIIPILDEAGKIIQYFSLRMHIDDKKKLENQKEMRILAMEEMLFQISHKVRQPIVQILGFAQLIETATISEDKLKEIAGYMKLSAQLLDECTRELTTFILQEKTVITSD